MGYNWTGKIIKGDYISDDWLTDMNNIKEYVLTNHCSTDYATNCPSNYGYCSSNNSSVNGSYAGGCSANNASVESSKYSSKCVNTYNRSYDSLYDGSVNSHYGWGV